MTDRKRERVVLLQIPPKWHWYPILNAWTEVYCDVFGCGIQVELCSLFSLLLCLSRRKTALPQEKFPTFLDQCNTVNSVLFSQSTSHDLFIANSNRCCKVSAKQLQCIYYCSVDRSWWTSAYGGILSKQDLYILRCYFIISLKSSYAR